MKTVGPAINLRTSCWLFPQNEQNKVPLSPSSFFAILSAPDFVLAARPADCICASLELYIMRLQTKFIPNLVCSQEILAKIL
jgi:hypothetical protein